MKREDKEWEEWERKVAYRMAKEREELKKLCKQKGDDDAGRLQ